MKKKSVDDDPLDREIDFSKGRPNPYFVAAVGPKYIRVLEADLAALFPDNESVNAALRTLADTKKRISARRVSAPKAAKKK